MKRRRIDSLCNQNQSFDPVAAVADAVVNVIACCCTAATTAVAFALTWYCYCAVSPTSLQFPIVLIVVNGMKPPISIGIETTTRSSTILPIVPYTLPHWCQASFTNPPQHGRFVCANLPTPLYRIVVPSSLSRVSSVPQQQQQPSSAKTTTTTESNNNTTHPNSNSIVAILQQQFNTNLYIKRDDCTHGIELGGNKVRKLEFLFADAILTTTTTTSRHDKNATISSSKTPLYDSVLTIGGIQSNHCRATACLARMIGLEPHLILRQPPTTTTTAVTGGRNTSNKKKNDVGLVGNVLHDRMVGSTIYSCTSGEYGRLGSTELLRRVAQQITIEQGKSPYIIPVGGSNGLGTWGYINAVDELLHQWNDIVSMGQNSRSNNNNLLSSAETTNGNNQEIHHIVVACGSGGTAAGIALGIALAYHNISNNNSSSSSRSDSHHRPSTYPSKPPIVHAIGVCDDADYFYKHIATIADEMGLIVPDNNDNNDDSSSTKMTTEQYIRQHLKVHTGKGRGYGQSTKEELDFIMQFAQETGIVLDPVYTGKAMYNFVKYYMQQQQPQSDMSGTKHQNVVFWHTGGGLGLFDKCNDLLQPLTQHSPCYTLDIYGGDDNTSDASAGGDGNRFIDISRY